MDEETERNIRIIYGRSLSDELFQRFISHINLFIEINDDSLFVHTISETTGRILEWNGIQYFTILHNSRPNRVVIGGTVVDRNVRGVPAIRFYDDNPVLSNIHSQYIFPYHKPNWTYIEICNYTIDILPQLFKSQMVIFIERNIR